MDGVSTGGGTFTTTHGGAGRCVGVLHTLLLVLAAPTLVLAGLVTYEAHVEVAVAADLAGPQVDVSAYADPPVATAGGVVTFTVLVENTGDVPLLELTITDGEDATYDHEGLAVPGEIVEHEITRAIDEDDARIGSVVSTFLAEASDEIGNEVNAAKTVTVEVLGHPQQRGAAWAGAPGQDGDSAPSRGLGTGTSIAIVALFTILAALLGGWVIGRVDGARSGSS